MSQITQKELRDALALKRRAADLEKDPAVAAWRKAVAEYEAAVKGLVKRAAQPVEAGALVLRKIFSSGGKRVYWEKVLKAVLERPGVQKAVNADAIAAAIVKGANEGDLKFEFVVPTGGNVTSVEIERAPKP